MLNKKKSENSNKSLKYINLLTKEKISEDYLKNNIDNLKKVGKSIFIITKKNLNINSNIINNINFNDLDLS